MLNVCSCRLFFLNLFLPKRVFENIMGAFTPKVAAIINFAMGHLTRMGEKRKVYIVLVWRLGG